MTVWICDRCGKQVRRDSNRAGKYEISVNCVEEDEYFTLRNYTRNIKLCDNCAMEMEKFLDDEFSKLPTKIAIETYRNG